MRGKLPMDMVFGEWDFTAGNNFLLCGKLDSGDQ